MPQHFGYDDEHESLSATLNFSGSNDSAGSDSLVDALRLDAPTGPDESGTCLDAIRTPTPAAGEDNEDEEGATLFTVTNPPRTVSVSALMDGSTHRVELSSKVTSMTESELAEEIVVLAGLARLKGLAGEHGYLEDVDVPETLQDLGIEDSGVLLDFMKSFVKVTTPEEAAAAEAEVFATRYATAHD